MIVAVVMLLWNTIEVGRNDAANLVNAVTGSRIMSRRNAVFLAGAAVIGGAVLSSDVIDTARKEIFDPTGIPTLKATVTIYISVYIVNTVLLYSYSAFGMPVSTTACLVFGLLGAAMTINIRTVNWGKAGIVISAIVCSIFLTGIAAFVIQRAARGAIRHRTTQLATMLLHGGWVGGGLAAGLCYFLFLKGMKNVVWIRHFKDWLESIDDRADTRVAGAVAFVLLWGFLAIVIHMLLVVFRQRAARLLFPVLAVLGMLAMAFAFGQNDLANCASPGLSAYNLIKAGDVNIGTEIPIAWWMLLMCGLLLVVGMATRNAERVTKAEISTGSVGDHVALWAPRWCISLAAGLLRFRGKSPALVPRAEVTPAGKTVHYDTLRACVIMSVSASVIATASSLGLPVSTTYVAFAAVVATGMADRIFQRGDAELKMGRAIWVVSSWFISAVIAVVAAGLVATIVLRLEIIGMAFCIGVNLIVRRLLAKRADAQMQRAEEEAFERRRPEAFALEEESD